MTTAILAILLAQMQMQHHHDPVAEFLMRQASGTSRDPSAATHSMSMTSAGSWALMLHGRAFISQVVQDGPRGADHFFSTNWIMGMAERPLGGGHVLFRSMLSLEPLTIGKKGYPELFQTGEGLIDRQHPHDLVMEIAAEYATEVVPGTIAYLYAAPVGDPALGPVAFPHRASSAELPQAPLSHHLQDSTHIASSVLTIGAHRTAFGLAVSGFHGREPDNQNRWNVDTGPIDSWSIRGTWDPTPNWSAQISTGHLQHPEAAEPGDIQRTTASISHSAGFSNGDVSSSVIWGWNHRSDSDASALLAESSLRFNVSNYVTGRIEIARKEEFNATIRALTAGYTKDVYRSRDLLGGVGGNVTVYGVPPALKGRYGDRPLSFYAFVRLRTVGM